MPQFDGYSDKKTASALDPAAITGSTTTNGNWFQINQFGSVTFDFFVQGWIDGVYTPKVEVANEDNQSDAADITESYLSQTLANAALSANGDVLLGILAKYKYARFSVVSTGVSSGATIVGARIIFEKPYLSPAA